MRKIITLFLTAFLLVAFAGCKETVAPQKITKLNSFQEKYSYSLGMGLGEYLKNIESKSGSKIDRAAFFQAISDHMDGKTPLLTKDEQKKVAEEMATKEKAKMASAGKENKQKGIKFLEENGKKEGVVTTKSGLQYKVLTEGKGKQPKATDKVEVNYRGTTIDGKEFDSSYKRGQTAKFPLNQVIKGWTEGVQLMKVGAKYKFFIPSELAYGERGAGSDIGPDETLIFDVELMSIQ